METITAEEWLSKWRDSRGDSMIEAYIKKIEECDNINAHLTNEIVLDVRIKIPRKPFSPDPGMFRFDTEEKYINAEADYQRQLVEWKALFNDIQFLHLGTIELKQDDRRM